MSIHHKFATEEMPDAPEKDAGIPQSPRWYLRLGFGGFHPGKFPALDEGSFPTVRVLGREIIGRMDLSRELMPGRVTKLEASRRICSLILRIQGTGLVVLILRSILRGFLFVRAAQKEPLP